MAFDNFQPHLFKIKCCNPILYLGTLIFVLQLISCSEKLNENSATYLLKTPDKERVIVNSDSLNIDLINGFRSLKLDSDIDSLDFNGWRETKLSEEIVYKRKELKLTIDYKNYNCNVKLTFFNKKLQIIELEFPEIKDNLDEDYIPEDLLEGYFHKPKLLEPFEFAYGEMKWARHYNSPFDIQNLITPKLYSENFIFHNKSVASNFVQKKQPRISTTQNNKLVSESGFYLGTSTKEFLYENIGLSNGIKILIENNIESYADRDGYSKNGSIITYNKRSLRLKESEVSIIIFKKNKIRDYLNSKHFIEQEKYNAEKKRTEKAKKIKDSLKRIEKVSEI